MASSKVARTSPIIAVSDQPEGRSAIPSAPVALSVPTPTPFVLYLLVIYNQIVAGWYENLGRCSLPTSRV